MPQYLPLPDGSYLTLQEGESPSEALERAKREAPEAFQPAAPAGPGGIWPAVKAGFTRLGGETALTAGKAGLISEEEAQAIQRRAEEKAATQFTPTKDGWVESPWQKLKETAGGSAAYMAAPLAAGLGAAALPVAAPVAGALGLGLGALVSTGQFTGSNLAAQMREGKTLGETSGTAAVGAAIPQALLDTMAMRMLPGIGKLYGAAGAKITEAEAKAIAQQGLKKAAADYAMSTGRVMGIESATETTQQVLERLQAGLSLSDPQARAEYLESAIGGAALAGVLGPFGRMQERGQIVSKGKEMEKARIAAQPAPVPPTPVAPDAAAIKQQYEDALKQQEVLKEQAIALSKSQDPADKVLYKQAQAALKTHVNETVTPLAEQYAPFKAAAAARAAKPVVAEAPEAPLMPDGTPIPTNSYEVQRMHEKALQGHTAAVQQAAQAARAGDLKAAQAAEEESQKQVALVRALQPHLPAAAAPAPRVAPMLEMQQRLTQLRGGTTAKGKPVEGLYAKALRIGDYEKAAAHRDEMATLQQQVTETQRTAQELQQRQADMSLQAVGPEPANPMAEFMAQNDAIDPNRDFTPREKQERATGKEIDAMEAGRMPTGTTAQIALAGDTETTYAKAPTIETLQAQLAQLPPAVQEQHAEMLTRLQDNLPAVAADPARVQEVSDWLYGLRTGRATRATADEMAADAGRSQEIGSMLDALAAGKMSETEQVLEPRYQQLTDEQKAALAGTQNRRNRVVTPTEPLPTGEVRTAVQRELPLYPTQEQTVTDQAQGPAAPKLGQYSQLPTDTRVAEQGKLFPTMKAFQKFLGGEALNKLRIMAGETVQTMTRALRMMAPIEKRIRLLEENAVREQELYQRAIATGERGSAAAEAAHAAAQQRLYALTQKLDKELQPLQIQWMEARNALKAAAEHSFDVADTWYKNVTKFGMVKEDAAEALRQLVDAKGRLADALQRPVSKAAWDEMRGAQTAIPEAQAFFDSHREALPEEINRFLAADRKANVALEQAVLTEGRLQEVHDAARGALDRLADNQQRRKTVQEERASATAESQYQEMMRMATAKAAVTARAVAAERAGKAATAVRGAQAEREAILAPVREAQAKRTERIIPEETQAAADARSNAARTAEQKFSETRGMLPGREVVSEQRRGWMNELADVEAEIARGQRLLANPDLTDRQRASGVTELNEAKRAAELLRTKLEQKEEQIAALLPKMEKTEKQVARLEGSEKGGIDEPGIASNTRASRMKELNKARKTLVNMRQAANKISGIKVTEKGEVAPARAQQSVADALEVAQENLEKAQAEGNARKVAFYEREIKLLESGTLPARKVGPLVKPVVLAGETRTGTAESKAGALKAGTRAKITQAGTPRGVTAKQSVREGNEVALEREARQGLDEETLRLREEAAKDREAVAAAKAAPKLTAAEQEELQAELDAEMRREGRRAASAPDDGRMTTPLSSTGVEIAEDGRILDLLDHVAETGATPERKEQAKALKALVMRTKLKVEDDLMLDGSRVAALYDPETNTVYLDRAAMSEEDFIHEVYHAATDSTLLAEASTLTPRQLQARKELTAMHEVLRTNPAFKDLHAATDVREFVAEVRTNDALRAQMQAVGKPATLWQRFTNALKRLLKLDSVSKADRLIEEILQPSRKISKAAATPSIFRAPPSALSTDLTDFSKYVQDDRSTLDKAKELKDSAGLAFRQAVADVRASLREALTYGDKAQSNSISALVTQRDSIINNMQAVADFGAFGTAKDAQGNLIVSAGHSKSLRDVIEAARGLPGADANERLKLFHDYRVAKRAEQVGWDKFDFKDTTAAATAGRKLLSAAAADPQLKAALAAVDKPYNDLNRGLIQFVADAHALPKEATDAMLADKNYVPFYRVNGDTISMVMPDGHPVSIGDIRTQPYLQSLVGGDQALMGFTDSVMRNISTLTSLALDNMTSKQVAYHLQDIARGTGKMAVQRGKGNAGQDVVRFRQSPDPKVPKDDGWRHITVDTQGTAIEGIPTSLLVQSIAGTYSTLPGFAKIGAVASDLLRSGVTRNPFYIVRQLLKDSVHASLTGNVESTPFMAVAKSLRNFIAIMGDQSPEAATLRKHGVLHSNIFSGTASDYNKVARMLAGDQQGWINRTLAFMDKAAMAADAATRTQVYQDIVAKGGTEMEAANAARELMNFNRHGSASSIQFFSRVIPFFNAAIQGLDVLYRSATGKMPAAERMETKQKFFNRAMGMSAMAVTYAVMMEDDPEWNSLTLQQKMANIIIPNGFSEDGESLKIPIPFETGMAFFSMPVAFVEAMRKDFTATDWKAVRSVLLAQMPGGGSLMPQIAKGAWDVSRNYNSFLGAPIESAKMAGLDPTQRFTSKTTEVAKAFSEAVNAVGIPLSPIQLEYLSNAYFAQLPLMVAESVNSLFEDADKVAPAKHLSESKVWGWLFQGEIGTDASAHAYEKATEAEMARKTVDKMVKSGDREGAKRYREEHMVEFATAQAAGAFTKRMGLLNTEMERIQNAPKAMGLTSEEKQVRIDRLKKIQQQTANDFLQKTQRIESNVERNAA